MSREAMVPVSLSREEMNLLLGVAGYYEKSMGPARHVVRLTAPRAVRARFRFLAAESALLAAFASAVLEEMEEDRMESRDVKFTLPALIAFWGRLLASLESKRARRRMQPDEVARRATLASKLQEVAASAAVQDRNAVEEVLATRRSVEAEWMRRRLNLSR